MAAAKAKPQTAEQELRDELADIGGDVMQALYPSWSIDTLLSHPRCALAVCREIARRMNRRCTEHFEDQCCRALLNARKRGDLRRDPA